MPDPFKYQIYNKDGKSAFVDGELFDKNVNGFAEKYKDATIRMVDPNGNSRNVPISMYEEAKRRGGRAYTANFVKKQNAVQNEPAQQESPAASPQSPVQQSAQQPAVQPVNTAPAAQPAPQQDVVQPVDSPAVAQPVSIDSANAQRVDTASRMAPAVQAPSVQPSSSVSQREFVGLRHSDKPFGTVPGRNAIAEAQKRVDVRKIIRENAEKGFEGFYQENVAGGFRSEKLAAEERSRSKTIEPTLQSVYSPFQNWSVNARNAVVEARETDPEKVANTVLNNIDEKALSDYVLRRMGIDPSMSQEEQTEVSQGDSARIKDSTAEMRDKVLGELQERMYNEYKEAKAPKSVLEYILSSAMKNNLSTRLLTAIINRAAGSRGVLQQLEGQALQEYGEKQSSFARGAAAAGSIMMDAPWFKGVGMIGNAARVGVTKLFAGGGKMAMNAIGNRSLGTIADVASKRWASMNPFVNVAAGSIGSGVTFGLYDTAGEAINEFQNGNLSLGGLASASGHGFLTGFAVGLLGGTISAATRNASKAKKLVADVGGFAGETALFTGLEGYEQMKEKHIGVADVDWASIAGKNAAMLGVLKLQSIPQIRERYKSTGDILTKDDKEALKAQGIDPEKWFGLDMLSKLSEERNYSLQRDGQQAKDAGLDNGAFREFLANENIPINTRRRVSYLMCGVATPEPRAYGMESGQDENGFFINTYTDNGKLIDRKTFKNQSDFNSAFEDVSGRVQLNTIDALRAMSRVKALFFNESILSVAEEAGIELTEISEAVRRVRDGKATQADKKIVERVNELMEQKANANGDDVENRAANAVLNSTGIDITKALSKKNSQRTPLEKQAVSEYVQRLQEELGLNEENTAENAQSNEENASNGAENAENFTETGAGTEENVQNPAESTPEGADNVQNFGENVQNPAENVQNQPEDAVEPTPGGSSDPELTLRERAKAEYLEGNREGVRDTALRYRLSKDNLAAAGYTGDYSDLDEIASDPTTPPELKQAAIEYMDAHDAIGGYMDAIDEQVAQNVEKYKASMEPLVDQNTGMITFGTDTTTGKRIYVTSSKGRTGMYWVVDENGENKTLKYIREIKDMTVRNPEEVYAEFQQQAAQQAKAELDAITSASMNVGDKVSLSLDDPENVGSIVAVNPDGSLLVKDNLGKTVTATREQLADIQDKIGMREILQKEHLRQEREQRQTSVEETLRDAGIIPGKPITLAQEEEGGTFSPYQAVVDGFENGMVKMHLHDEGPMYFFQMEPEELISQFSKNRELEEAGRMQAEEARMAEEKAKAEAEAAEEARREAELQEELQKIAKNRLVKTEDGKYDFEKSKPVDVAAYIREEIGLRNAGKMLEKTMAPIIKEIQAFDDAIENGDLTLSEAADAKVRRDWAQDRLDFWNEVKEGVDSLIKNEKVTDLTKEGKAPRERKYKPLEDARDRFSDIPEAVDALSDLSPRNLEEVASEMLWSGEVKLLQNDDTSAGHTIKGYKSHTGFSQEEATSMLRYSATRENGGIGIEHFGELVLDRANALGVQYDRSDANAGLDAVVNLLSGTGRDNPIANYIANQRIAEAKAIADAYYRQREDDCWNQYGMGYYEYEAMQEAIWDYADKVKATIDEAEEFFFSQDADRMAEEKRSTELLNSDYFNTFAEEFKLAQDAYFKDLENEESNDNDQSRAASGIGNSGEVQQGQRPDGLPGERMEGEEMQSSPESNVVGNVNVPESSEVSGENAGELSGESEISKPGRTRRSFKPLLNGDKTNPQNEVDPVQEKFDKEKASFVNTPEGNAYAKALQESNNVRETVAKIVAPVAEYADGYKDWAGRQYKKNNTAIDVGGKYDDLDATTTSIGSVNERRRNARMAEYRRSAEERMEWVDTLLKRCGIPAEERNSYLPDGFKSFDELISDQGLKFQLNSKQTPEDAEKIVSRMKDSAEEMRIIEFNEENFNKEFSNGEVTTPIGKVKIGKNQFSKIEKGDNGTRGTRFGMAAPTLERPDIILEKHSPKDGAERDTKYLFVKSFKKGNDRVYFFEHVTVSKEGNEVSVSSHDIEASKVKKELKENNLLWTRFSVKSDSSDKNQGLDNQQGMKSEPVENGLNPQSNLFNGKDTALSSENQISSEKSSDTEFPENSFEAQNEEKIDELSGRIGDLDAEIEQLQEKMESDGDELSRFTTEQAIISKTARRNNLQSELDGLQQANEISRQEMKVPEKLEDRPVESVISNKEKIQDFGEKIGMARKDTAKSGFKRSSSDGVPSWKKKYKVHNADVKALSGVDKWSFSSWMNAQDMVLGEGPDKSKPFIAYTSESKKTALGNWERHYPVTDEHGKIIVFNSEEEFEATIPVYEAAQQKYKVRKGSDGQYKIVRPASNGKLVEYATFDTEEQAKAYLASPEGATSLLNHKRENYELPALENLTRNNMPDYRNGKDATPEMFMSDFGFRGGEFGNWVNAEERQQFLNLAYDAFMDLADVLDVSPKAISLGGELSIAFGARGGSVKAGGGSAAAHYEPGRAVINLTKMHGAGSVAHEWAHALDNYFGLQGRGVRRDREKIDSNDVFITTSYARHELRPEVRDAIADIVRTMTRKTVTRKVKADIDEEEMAKLNKSFDYAVRQGEKELSGKRTSRKYNRKTKEYEYTDHTLTDEQKAKAMELISKLPDDPTFKFTYDWSKNGHRAEGDVAKELYSLISDVLPNEKRSFGPLHNVFLYADKLKEKKDRMKDAAASKDETVVANTDYVNNSSWFDRERATNYWTKPEELFARAMESWIADKMEEQGKSSDYLTYKKGGIYEVMFKHNPYPTGEERIAINESFQKLFDTIEEKVEDGKILLHEDSPSYEKGRKIALDAEKGVSLQDPTGAYTTRDGRNVVYKQLNLFDNEGEATEEAKARQDEASDTGTQKTEGAQDSEKAQEMPSLQDGGAGASVSGAGSGDIQREAISLGSPLRNLNPGEFCNVERQYTENGHYSFTSRTNRIESVEDVAYIFKSLEDKAVENSFVALVKDGKPYVIHLGIGGINEATVDLRLVVPAVHDINPDEIYLVHNHPSGRLVASRPDAKLQDKLVNLFGYNKVKPAIIIDTNSGKYAVFDELGNTDIYDKEGSIPENEIPVKVFSFDKQLYYNDWKPGKSRKIGSDEIASFVTTQRTGQRGKLSALILSNNLDLTGNIHLPYSDIVGNEKEIAGEINYMVAKMGGTGAIIYGNRDLDIRRVGTISQYISNAGFKLYDVIAIEEQNASYRSANDESFLEPEPKYGIDKDSMYEQAVRDGNLDKARKMLRQAAAENGYSENTDYQGSVAFNGTAPGSNGYFDTREERIEAFENGDFEGTQSFGDYTEAGLDGWDLGWQLSNPAPASHGIPSTLESIRNLSGVARGQGKTIKMYRAVPADIKEESFRNGDWVTPSRRYAEYHITLQDWDGGRIIEQEVPVDDIWWDGNDINEWGYDDGKQYAYRNTENNRKLLDITYDENGDLIPLSERFNQDNPDTLHEDEPEYGRHLAGVHNIYADKLRKAMKLGGLANPSTAVIDTNKNDLNSYGEISLVMPSSMVDAKTGRNAGTWTADAWTPVFPQIVKKIPDGGYDLLNKDMEVLDMEGSRDIWSRTRNDLSNYLERDNSPYGLSFWYLTEKGLNPEVVRFDSGVPAEDKELYSKLTANDTKRAYELSKDEIRQLLGIYAKSRFNTIKGKPGTADEILALYQELREEWVKDLEDPNVKGFIKRHLLDSIEGVDTYGVPYSILSDFTYAMGNAIRKDGKIDANATLGRAENKVKKAYDAEFLNWLDGKMQKYGVQEKFYAGMDKNGKAIYKPNTLEAVSRHMKSQGRNGSLDWSTTGNLIATVASRVRSLKQIRNVSGNLTATEQEHKDFKEKWGDILFDIADECYRISSDPNAGFARLAEALREDNPALYLKKEYGVSLSTEARNNLSQFIDEVQNHFPTGYFETKFERPVMLNEFAAAVVPGNVADDIRSGLQKAGLKVIEYEPGNEESRKAAMQEAFAEPEVRFSESAPMAEGNGTVRSSSTNPDDVRKELDSLSSAFHTPVIYHPTLDDVPAGWRKKKGVFNTETGEIHLIGPNLKDVKDAHVTFLHEVTAHNGLRRMLGDKEFNGLCDRVWAGAMDKESQERCFINAFARNSRRTIDEIQREAADEYMANLSESEVKPSFWKRIKAWIKNLFHKLGINLRMTDDDIQYMLWKSRNRLMEGDNLEATIRKTAADSRKRREMDVRAAEAKEKQDWETVVQSFDQASRTNDDAGLPDSSNPVAGAKLGKIENITKSLNGLSGEISKKSLSPDDLLNRIAGSLGINNQDKAKSKYPKEVITVGNGNEITIRIANHSANVSHYTEPWNINAKDANYGIVIQLNSVRFKHDKDVDYLEFVYNPSISQSTQIDLVNGIRHLIETGSISKMPKPMLVNPSGSYRDIAKKINNDNPQIRFRTSSELDRTIPGWNGGPEERYRSDEPIINEQAIEALQMLYPEKTREQILDEHSELLAEYALTPAEELSSLIEKFGSDERRIFDRAADYLTQANPVSELSGDEFQKEEGNRLTDRVAKLFEEQGGKAKSPFGTVILDRKSAKNSINHGMSRDKAAAFASVKDVIEKGIEILPLRNWRVHGKAEKTGMVAAPITINGERRICVVEVISNKKDKHLYTHEAFVLDDSSLPSAKRIPESGVPSYSGAAHESVANVLKNFLKEEFGKRKPVFIDYKSFNERFSTGRPIKKKNESQKDYLDRLREWEDTINRVVDENPDMKSMEQINDEIAALTLEKMKATGDTSAIDERVEELRKQLKEHGDNLDQEDKDRVEYIKNDEESLSDEEKAEKFTDNQELNIEKDVDAYTRRVFQEQMKENMVDTSDLGIRRTIKESIIERRNILEVSNYDDAVFFKDIERRTTEEQRKALPFILEGYPLDELPDDLKNRLERFKTELPSKREVIALLRMLAHDAAEAVLVEGNMKNEFDRLEASLSDTVDSETSVLEHGAISDREWFHNQRQGATFSLDSLNPQTPEGTVIKNKYRSIYTEHPEKLPETTGLLTDAVSKYYNSNLTDLALIDYRDLKNMLMHLKPDTGGVEVTPELKQVALEIRQWFDDVYEMLKGAGFFDAENGSVHLDNYVTHIWKFDTPSSEMMSKYEERLRTSSPYVKHRLINSLREGIEMGLSPKFDDIVKIMSQYGRYANEAVVNRGLINNLLGFSINKMPVLMEKTKAISGYKEMPGATLEKYKVHPSAYRMLQAVFLPSETSDDVNLRGISGMFRVASAFMKKMVLNASFFHHIALTESIIANTNPVYAMNILLNKVIMETAKTGKLPAYQDESVTRDAVAHLVKLGVTDDYNVNYINSTFEAFAKGLEFVDMKAIDTLDKWIGDHPTAKRVPKALINEIFQPVIDSVRGVDVAQRGMDTLLWDMLHDAYKLWTYKYMADEIRGRKLSDKKQEERLLNSAGQWINDSFGGQHWEVIGMSPQFVRFLSKYLLSADWTVSAMFRQSFSMAGFGNLYNVAHPLGVVSDAFHAFANGDSQFDQMRGINRWKQFCEEWKDWVQNAYLTEEAKFRLKKSYRNTLMGWITTFGFYGLVGALARFVDVQTQEKIAEERRAAGDKDYLSPYEILYPHGMKWYDYTFPGNTYGNKTYLFAGRYPDGTERYAREGKQYREIVEMFYGRDGFEVPGAFIDKMVGKLNPMWQLIVETGGGAMNSKFVNREIRDAKPGVERTMAILNNMIEGFVPWSLVGEWDPLNHFMPNVKGMRPYRARTLMEEGLINKDLKLMEEVRKACIMNGLDTETIFKAAKQNVYLEYRKSLMDGVNDLQDAIKQFDTEPDLGRKDRLGKYIDKQLGAELHGQLGQTEFEHMINEALEGRGNSKDDDDAYLKYQTSDDRAEDVRFKKAMATLKPIYNEWNDLSGRDKQEYYDYHRREIDSYKSFRNARSGVNQLKKSLKEGRRDPEEIMENIREIRRKALRNAASLK